LLALTGSNGTWRKTLAEKSIAYENPYRNPNNPAYPVYTVGLPNMGPAQLETQIFSVILENFSTKVGS